MERNADSPCILLSSGPVCRGNLRARWEVESADCDKRNGKEAQAASQVDGPDAQV